MSVPPQYGQNPEYNNAPNDTQAISLGGQYPGGNRPNPVAHPKLKSLLNLTLASAGVYALSHIISMFVKTPEASMKVNGEQQLSDAAMGGLGVVANIIILIIMLGIYFLVYSLLKKGKNAGRITGIVFCILGTLGALIGIFNIFNGGLGILVGILQLVMVIVNVLWLVKAFDRDVKASLI